MKTTTTVRVGETVATIETDRVEYVERIAEAHGVKAAERMLRNLARREPGLVQIQR